MDRPRGAVHAEGMHLLCGLDDSAPARAAAHVARMLARRLDADLTLAHVGPGTPDVAHDVRIDARRPAEALLALADEHDSALILLGHTRRGPVADALVGQVQRGVLRATTRPVALVPAGATLPDAGPVVLACRRSADPPRSARVAGRLAAALEVPLTITQVLDRRRPTSWRIYDAARRDCQAAVDAGGDVLDVDCLELRGDPAATLAEACGTLDAAMLVIGERRQGRVQALVRPSLAARVARRSQRPVIVVP